MALRRIAVLLTTSSAFALFLSVGTGSVAGATSPTSTAIAPHEQFVGLVNGRSTGATITVFCPGPIRSGETGRQVSGQSIAVEPPSTISTTTGYTGAKAHSVIATLEAVTPLAATDAVTFTHFGSGEIPTSLAVPCGGSGSVLFSPEPTSKTAETVDVPVKFADLAVTPVPTTAASSRKGRA